MVQLQAALVRSEKVIKEMFRLYDSYYSSNYRSVVLVAGPIGLEQKDPSSNKLLATYYYKDMDGISEVSDYPGGFVITKSHFGRMHMFASEGREEIIKRLQEAAANFTGLVVRRLDPIKLETFQTKKFGQFSDDEFITSISEFTVQVRLKSIYLRQNTNSPLL